MSDSLSTPTALVRALGEAQYKLREISEHASALEVEVQVLRAKTNNRRKLRPFEVRQLRTMAASGNVTQRQLAEYFQINTGTVSRIVNGVYYKEVS
jgi:DNA-binding transcriptional regulator YiaG